MVELGKFALDLIMKLLTGAIQQGVNYAALPYFQRRKIERRIEDATAEVVEPLLPFLAREGIPEDKQRRLIETCVDELRPLTKQPERLFQGSLDGQKIFEELYAKRDLPQVVIEDDLKDVYTLLCPRIATLLCKIPAAVKDWENEAWSENFRRFDEIAAQMRALFTKVDELAALPSREADATFTIVRRALAQKIGLELDLTGLRADRPLAGKFDDFFVHPLIEENLIEGNMEAQPRVVGTPAESFDLFTQARHQAIVIGAPGAGKSTWSKWLQREVMSARWTGISVRVELRRFSSDPMPSLHELIREAAGKHLAEELTAERIGQWLEEKQVVFILDGFDEIHPSKRDEIYEWVVELSTASRGCPFVLTSRPLTTKHLDCLGTAWQCWTMEPFDESRIIDYIERWYAHTPLLPDADRGVDAATLSKSWLADSTIGPLTGNPLLLSTLLMVHHLDGSLPGGRSQLYRRYVEGMLGLWDDRRKVTATSVPLTLEQKRQILRGLALHLFLRGEEQLDEPAMVDLVQELLQKQNISLPAEQVLATLRERSGLIIGPGIYSFAHKSVAEYLVAEAVLQGDQRDASERRIDRFCLFEHRGEDRWNTVIFLWAGLAPMADVEAFIDACIEAGAWDVAYGILYDQYERIPMEMRRRLLLEMTLEERKPIHFDRERSYYIYSHPRAIGGVGLEIPDFNLRSLAGLPDLNELVIRAVSDGSLRWTDSVNAPQEVRDLLWMACAGRAQSVDDWKSCLASPCPKQGQAYAWLFWVAEYLFLYAAREEISPQDLAVRVGAYKNVCPYVCGLVSIALVSVVVELIEQEEPETSDLESAVRLLEFLPPGDDREIIPEDWLLGTRDWALMSLRNVGNEPIEDLFAVFVDDVQALSEQGVLKQDTTERAIDFVRKLQERREMLQPSFGAHPSLEKPRGGRRRRRSTSSTHT
jgi:hypothetical protein